MHADDAIMCLLLIFASFVLGFTLAGMSVRYGGSFYADEVVNPLYKLCNPDVEMKNIKRYSRSHKVTNIHKCINSESWKGSKVR